MAFDSLRYPVSNVTITASYNGTAVDLLNTPGGPIQGYTFAGYMSNGIGTSNSATVTNTSAAANGTIVFTVQEGSESSFTNSLNTRVLFQQTFTIGSTAALALQAIAMQINPTQRYIRHIVNPSAGVSLVGYNWAEDSGLKIAS